MRGNRCAWALLHVAALGWRQPRRSPPDGRAQGIRPPLYRRDWQKLVEETIRTHRDVADAIASRNPTAAHDAMYLHLVYNRNMIAEGAEAKGI